MAIPLGRRLPDASSDLPEGIGRATLISLERENALLFGLAPDGVCLAPGVTTWTGELLPHRFTLARTPYNNGAAGGLFSVALSWGHPHWALPSTLPCGARTFLP